MSAVVVASTFWLEAGSISTVPRVSKKRRPVRASMTRIPTRVRRRMLSCRISRSAVCMRTIRSWSRSSAAGSGAISVTRACLTGAGVARLLETAARARAPPDAISRKTSRGRRLVMSPSLRSHAAKAEIAVAGVGGPGVPVGGARADEEAAARAAAHDAPARILVVLVRHPFPDVAAHVEHAVGAGPRGVLSDGDGAARVLAGAGPFALEVPPVGAGAV